VHPQPHDSVSFISASDSSADEVDISGAVQSIYVIDVLNFLTYKAIAVDVENNNYTTTSSSLHLNLSTHPP
jgi:hypothetical protein